MKGAVVGPDVQDEGRKEYCEGRQTLSGTPPTSKVLVVRSSVRKLWWQLKTTGVLCTVSTERGAERMTDSG
jgi:hypothetical protein